MVKSGVREDPTAEGKTMLLALLQVRQLELTSEEKRVVHACTDLWQLEEWLRRASIARQASEIFSPFEISAPRRRRPRGTTMKRSA
jgi:hypothetical protein